MAQVVATIKVMPEGPDTDLEALQTEAEKEIKEFGADIGKAEIEPIAFGLKALNMTFVLDESLGSPDPIAEKIAELDGVNSAETTDVRRAVG